MFLDSYLIQSPETHLVQMKCLPLFFCSASAASVERKDREKKKKKIERFLNGHLVSIRQLFYCSGLYSGLGFKMLAIFQSSTLVNARR